MTIFTLFLSIGATLVEKQESMSVLAYRTAMFTRMKNQHLPKNEAELLKKPKPKNKPQSLKDQLAMAKFMTQVMGKAVH